MSPWLPKAGEQNYCHERGVLRQPRLVLSQFWRPEVQGQGESGLWFSLEALRRICSLPSPDLIFFWPSLTGSFIALTFACLYTSSPPHSVFMTTVLVFKVYSNPRSSHLWTIALESIYRNSWVVTVWGSGGHGFGTGHEYSSHCR